MQGVKDSNGGKRVTHRRKLLWVKEGRGRLYPQATIDVLPDNVLLEIFEFYLGKDDTDQIDDDHNYDGWQMLVHMCYRWRCIVFASPRRLALKLYCTRKQSVNSQTLDIWPALPIVISALDMQSKEDVTNVIAALRHHSRVCKIHYLNGQFQDPMLKEFATIDKPFLALTSLQLSSFGQPALVLPNSFLGGSAPCLRSLNLFGIPYLSIGKLLSSTTNLVRLSLFHIPHTRYIPPETIVPCLSTLARLKSLVLQFQYPRSWAHQAGRHPPPLTCVVLPNLTCLDFRGDVEYLEDILSQIKTPILHQSYFCLFNQLIFDTPLLGCFICRTETFMTIHTAHVEFHSSAVEVTLWGQEAMIDNNTNEALQLEISCEPLDWQLSALAQVFGSFLSSLPALESLEIAVSHEDWQGEIEDIQWRELLHSFASVKDMALELGDSVQLVSPALQELAGERATEVLPALQNLFLKTDGGQPSRPVKEAIEQFIAKRQLCGNPVTVHYHDTESEEE